MQKLFSREFASQLTEDIKKEAQEQKDEEQQAKEKVLDKLDDALHNKVKEKSKLSIDEQIEYLNAKGIQFNIMSDAKAKQYLMENSYYYKVTAYRFNFKKNKEGKYQNLEFAFLKDLAIIDMHLRYLVLKLSLDLEHTLKSLVVNLITDDPGEDGYQIIEDFNNYHKNRIIEIRGTLPEDYKHIKDRIIKEVKDIRDYNYDFYIKTKEKISIWKLIEMMSYGHLSSFIKFYVDSNRHKSKQLKKAAQFLSYSKNIRDAAAHSRPILLNVTEVNQLKGSSVSHRTKQAQAEIDLKTYVKRNGLHKKTASRLLTNFKIHDLCSLILLHDEYIHGKYMRRARKKEMITLYIRARYKKNMYKDVKEFNEIMELFFGVIKKY